MFNVEGLFYLRGSVFMIERLSHVTTIVKDIDEALDFYTKKLGFMKVTDNRIGDGYRWVTVAPKGQQGLEIVLQHPDPAMHGAEGAKELMKEIGKGTTWVFKVDDCKKTCDQLRKKGVEILQEPEALPYGVEAVFEDLYGNRFVLMERPE
jgi:predicted enzyme related to lactoylglutathione lyase